MTVHSTLVSLVADVGGTNTRVGVADGAILRPGSVSRFRNADFPDLGAVLDQYVADLGHPFCNGVCAAVAGPVEQGVARLTNLDWRIDTPSLAAAARADHAALLNDLQAQGYGALHLTAEQLRPVLSGTEDLVGAAQIVIGVGTGFNIAPIYRVDGRVIVSASEAGHVSLPVVDSDDLALAQFVAGKHGFADVEEILSGRGIETLYRWVTRHRSISEKSAADIMRGFEHERTEETQATAELFAKVLGRVAGDICLTHLPYGGVYLSGGVSRAIGPYLLDLGFKEAFFAKGRFSDLMQRFSVHVIEDDFAALSGCAAYLDQMYGTVR